MFPGDSDMFQVFGWDTFGNLLTPDDEWVITLHSAEVVIIVTDTITSPAGNTWLFPLFTRASKKGDTDIANVSDNNEVADNATLTVTIVNCSNGYEYNAIGDPVDIVINSTYTESTEYYTCTGCLAQTYTMTSEQCLRCPDLGIVCTGLDEILIDEYWYAYNKTDGTVIPAICPIGYCCSDSNGCDYSDKTVLCASNRDPEYPLCGKCFDGYAETSNAKGGCAICEDSAALIFAVPAILGFALIAFYLKSGLKKQQQIPHEMMVYLSRTALFIFQLLPFLTFQSSGANLLPLASIANFEMDMFSSSDEEADDIGSCYTATLSARNKLFIGLVPSGILAFQLVIAFIVFEIKLRTQKAEDEEDKIEKVRRRHVWEKAFFQVTLQISLMLYAKITSALIKLDDCRPLAEPIGLVMFYAGSIQCPNPIWYATMAGLLVCISVPFGVAYALKREMNRPGGGWKQVRLRYPIFVLPYRRSAYWYAAWNLARSFIVIIVASLPTERPDYTGTALSVVMGFIFGLHVYVKPFYHKLNNELETYCLFCGFAITILNVIISKPTYFEYATGIFTLLPIVPMPYVIWLFIKSKSPVTLQMVNKDFNYDTRSSRRRHNLDGGSTKAAAHKRHQLKKYKKELKRATFKVITLPGGKHMHAMHKSKLDVNMSKEADAEISFEEDDSRTWRSMYRSDSRQARDAFSAIVDQRRLQAIGTAYGKSGLYLPHMGKYWDEDDYEEDDYKYDDSEDEKRSNLSELDDNEVSLSEDDSTNPSDDYFNEYFERERNKNSTWMLFGGRIKIRRQTRLKDEPKIKLQKLQALAAQRREQQQRFGRIAETTHLTTKMLSTNAFDAREEDKPTSPLTGSSGDSPIGGDFDVIGIQMQPLYDTASKVDDFMTTVDPVEQARVDAKEKKRERQRIKMEKAKKKRELELKLRQETEKKRMQELWDEEGKYIVFVCICVLCVCFFRSSKSSITYSNSISDSFTTSYFIIR